MSVARTWIARLAGLVVARALRILGRAGTTLPGRVFLGIDPDGLGTLSGDLRMKIFVSATNGKTTTAALISAALEGDGRRVVHNAAGANMAGGIASALLANRPNGKREERDGLFEVDEFWLDRVCRQLVPDVVVLGNLFRDQLDRYGELDTIVERWREAVCEMSQAGTTLLMCCDDPVVASLADGLGGVRWFGLEDRSVGLTGLPHAADAITCRRCGERLEYDLIILGHQGHWHCPACGNRRPTPDFRADSIRLSGARGSSFMLQSDAGSFEMRSPLPGLYNVCNALGAWAASCLAGVVPEAAVASMASAQAAFGRGERVTIGRHEATLMLIKNPTGANEVLRTVASEPAGFAAVLVLNDRIADGRDVSWIWDADFEMLVNRAGSFTVGGTRAAEMALRLRYAGVDQADIAVVPGIGEMLARAGDLDAPGLWVLPTYTAMREVREQLSGQPGGIQ